MRVRVKFAKYGPMKFIGHLELMRYLQSAVRRTEIPVKYDEGMHQRMVMSFAMPLGVGPTSSAEYMDIELVEPISSEKAMKQLEEHMCEGLDILDFREVDGAKKQKAMTIVAAADYEVRFREGFEPDWDWRTALREFCARESIPWVKETKKGTREVDMKEWIHEMSDRGTVPLSPSAQSVDALVTAPDTGACEVAPDAGAFDTAPDTGACEAAPDTGACETAPVTIYLRLCCSVGDNLKPEQLFGEMFRSYGHELPRFALQVHRLDLLTRDEAGKFVSLGELGERIP